MNLFEFGSCAQLWPFGTNRRVHQMCSTSRDFSYMFKMENEVLFYSFFLNCGDFTDYLDNTNNNDNNKISHFGKFRKKKVSIFLFPSFFPSIFF